MNNFSAEQMFQHYMQKSYPNRHCMSSLQIQELKKAFYGALASFIVVLSKDYESDEEMYEMVQGISDNVTDFWNAAAAAGN